MTYSKNRSIIYISDKADSRITEYIKNRGLELSLVVPHAYVDPAIASHPDIYMCRLKDRVYHGNPDLLGPKYPSDVLYNAAAVGDYIICSRFTSRELLETCCLETCCLKPLLVPQGYVKCNLAVVDDSHVITEDEGIARILALAESVTGINCLKIEPHNVMLPGYKYGFIGGASGRIDYPDGSAEIIFNGDLSRHPDYIKIRSYIEACGLGVKYFEDYPLTDIGSIIQG